MTLDQRIDAAALARQAEALGMTPAELAAWSPKEPSRVELEAERIVRQEQAYRRFRAQVLGPLRG